MKSFLKDLASFFFVFGLAISIVCLLVEVPVLFAHMLGNELWPNAVMQIVALGMITPAFSLVLTLYRPHNPSWFVPVTASASSGVIAQAVAELSNFVTMVTHKIKSIYTDGLRVTIMLVSILVWFVSMNNLQDVYDEQAGDYLLLGSVLATLASAALLTLFWYTRHIVSDLPEVKAPSYPSIKNDGPSQVLQNDAVAIVLAIFFGGTFLLWYQLGKVVPEFMVVLSGGVLAISLWYLVTSNVMRPGLLVANLGSALMGVLVSLTLIAYDAGNISKEMMHDYVTIGFFLGAAIFNLGFIFQGMADKNVTLFSK